MRIDLYTYQAGTYLGENQHYNINTNIPPPLPRHDHHIRSAVPLVAFSVKILGLLQPQVISVHQNDFIKGKLPNLGFLDWILITYLATILGFYHCSATKEVL